MTEAVENRFEHNGNLEEQSEEQSVTSFPKATRKEIIVTDYIRKSLDIVASSEGFKNYELIFDHGSNIGDGFVGIILKVNVKENDSDKSFNVLAKIPPQNQARREMPGVMLAFDREVYLYNVLLPELITFQKEKKITRKQGFFNFPKVYYADFNHDVQDGIIIMEDLRETGHRMWDKYKPIDFDHSKLLMENLGRLHALSFAMKKQRPELFENLRTLKDVFSMMMNDENMRQYINQAVMRCTDALDEKDSKVREKFELIAEKAYELVVSSVDSEGAEPYAVLNHGDCWMNNFLYHYDKRGRPEEIVFIDWQISRYCSPVVDLLYFMFICTDKPTRDRHFDELLGIYHRSLKELLDHLGGDTATQFPFTALLRHLKRYGKFGLIMAAMIVPMLQTNNEDLPDMDYIAEQVLKMDENQQKEMIKQFQETNKESILKINARIRDLILDAARFGYL